MDDEVNLVQELERRLLPILEKAAAQIRGEYPGVIGGVFSFAIGSLTNSPGHQLGIGYGLPDIKGDQPDEIVLGIGLRSPATNPMINADVCWGYPGYTEAELYPKPVAVTTDVLEQLEAELPNLCEALKIAIRRGHPPAEAVL